MKLRLTFKCPDAVDDAIQSIVHEDKEVEFDERAKAEEACNNIFRYGEYVDIEIDTETHEAKVIMALDFYLSESFKRFS